MRIHKLAVMILMVLFNLDLSAQNEAAIAAKTAELEQVQSTIDSLAKLKGNLEGAIKALKPIQKWQTGGFQSVNFNQVGLTNWSKGGVNSISVTALGNLYANYKFKNWSWENNLDLAYGLIKNEGEEFRKNEDKIDLITKVGRRASKQFNWAAFARLETQFAEGFDFAAPEDDRPVISNFFAPAYLKTTAGLDYKPNGNISIYISPFAGKFTFVSDDSIAARRLYIPEEVDNPNFRSEFGAMVSATYQNKEIIKNLGLRSRLELFNNYTDPNRPNRRNIDVDWQTIIDMKFAKYFGANLFTHLIYDHDTKVEIDPENQPGRTGVRTQFKEVFGVGFSYKF